MENEKDENKVVPFGIHRKVAVPSNEMKKAVYDILDEVGFTTENNDVLVIENKK